MTDDTRWPSLLDAAGRIRIDAVNQLSRAQLAAWLDAVLRGGSVATGADRDESPADLLERTYRRLDPFVRQTFQDIVLALLSGLPRALPTSWTVTAAEHLLLLVAAVFPGTPGAPPAIDLLRLLADRAPDVAAPGSEAVPVFALKGLVALGHRTAPEFWHRQYRRHGARAAGAVLRGLALWHLDSAFAWLDDHVGDAAAMAALRAALPLLVEEFGPGALQDHLARLTSRLPDDDAAALARTCHAIGLADARSRLDLLAPEPPPTDPASLARHLERVGLRQVTDPEELRERLTAQLDASNPASDDLAYVRALLVLGAALLDPAAACKALRRLRAAWRGSTASMSDARRNRLAQLIDEVESAGPALEVSYELEALAYMLRNEHLNITAELARILSARVEG